MNGGKWQVSTSGGSAPLRAHNGRELFYVADGKMHVTPDDERFLMVRDDRWEDMAGTPTLVVVQGFFDEPRAKVKR